MCDGMNPRGILENCIFKILIIFGTCEGVSVRLGLGLGLGLG